MQRLQTRAQFQAVLAGRTIARTRHFALHCVALPAPEIAPPPKAAKADARGNAGAGNPLSKPLSKPLFMGDGDWLGAMTPKRAAKRAVTRNAIKRQIYQLSTDLNSQPPSAAYVVRLAAGFDKAEFPSAASPALKAAVREELVLLFHKAGLSMSSACGAAPAALLSTTP